MPEIVHKWLRSKDHFLLLAGAIFFYLPWHTDFWNRGLADSAVVDGKPALRRIAETIVGSEYNIHDVLEHPKLLDGFGREGQILRLEVEQYTMNGKQGNVATLLLMGLGATLFSAGVTGLMHTPLKESTAPDETREIVKRPEECAKT